MRVSIRNQLPFPPAFGGTFSRLPSAVSGLSIAFETLRMRKLKIKFAK